MTLPLYFGNGSPMSSDNSGGGFPRVDGCGLDSVEHLLVDSLVHHLVEKGILTKNDALSVVQTAAEVVSGRAHEVNGGNHRNAIALAALRRIYASFEALPDNGARPEADGRNVHVLRAPVHGDQPRFPSDDN